MFLTSCLTHILSVVQGSLGKISLTMDLWSDINLTPSMAATAHWIQAVKNNELDGTVKHALRLRADLIGFHRVPGRHNGEHIAHAFLYVLDRVEIADKVHFQYYLS